VAPELSDAVAAGVCRIPARSDNEPVCVPSLFCVHGDSLARGSRQQRDVRGYLGGYKLTLRAISIQNQYVAYFEWCPHTDSNRGPTDYKSVALPAEL
jgi:hypothetical protein